MHCHGNVFSLAGSVNKVLFYTRETVMVQLFYVSASATVYFCIQGPDLVSQLSLLLLQRLPLLLCCFL